MGEKNRQQRQSFNRRDLRVSSLRSDTLFQELTPAALPPCPPRLSLHMQFARAPPCRDSRSPPAWSGPPSWLTPPRSPRPAPPSQLKRHPLQIPGPSAPTGNPSSSASARTRALRAVNAHTLAVHALAEGAQAPGAFRPSVRLQPQAGLLAQGGPSPPWAAHSEGMDNAGAPRAVRRRSEPGRVSICALVPQDYEKPQLLGLQRQTRDLCDIYPNDSDNV